MARETLGDLGSTRLVRAAQRYRSQIDSSRRLVVRRRNCGFVQAVTRSQLPVHAQLPSRSLACPVAPAGSHGPLRHRGAGGAVSRSTVARGLPAIRAIGN
jgi:hypothetical protein